MKSGFKALGKSKRAGSVGRPVSGRVERVKRVAWGAVIALAGVMHAADVLAGDLAHAALRTAIAYAGDDRRVYVADATVEAVLDSRVAAQVTGRLTGVLVHAGDHVQQGQVLLHIDPAVATRQLASSRSQLEQARALLAAAQADYARAKGLFAQHFLSAAALDHAQTQFKAAQAAAMALEAQAAAAGEQAAHYTLRAPYSGWVAQVHVAVGDMATPGMPLVHMYDPTALRVTAQLPETVTSTLNQTAAAAVEIDGVPVQLGRRTTVLPGRDAATHSATVRVDLSPQEAGVQPGQFARVSFPLKAADGGPTDAAGRPIHTQFPTRVSVPRSAVVRRGELAGVYVVGGDGKAQLRQVRLGRDAGGQIEVLAGLNGGERVALDPVAAAVAQAN